MADPACGWRGHGISDAEPRLFPEKAAEKRIEAWLRRGKAYCGLPFRFEGKVLRRAGCG